jgi:hypothetical protein
MHIRDRFKIDCHTQYQQQQQHKTVTSQGRDHLSLGECCIRSTIVLLRFYSFLLYYSLQTFVPYSFQKKKARNHALLFEFYKYLIYFTMKVNCISLTLQLPKTS